MGFLDKLKFNNQDFDETDNDESGYDYSYEEQGDSSSEGKASAVKEPVRDNRGMGIGANSSSIELKVVKPKEFETAPQIADHLLSRRTVVLNLEGTNKETAKRIIDFLSGVAYSIDGQIRKVASDTYVITPPNVEVSGDPMRRKEEKAEAPSSEE